MACISKEPQKQQVGILITPEIVNNPDKTRKQAWK